MSWNATLYRMLLGLMLACAMPAAIAASGWKPDQNVEIVGPKGMKDDQVRYWDGVFAAFTQLDEWKKEADKRMLDNVHLTSAQTRSAMDALYKELREILGQLGLAK